MPRYYTVLCGVSVPTDWDEEKVIAYVRRSMLSSKKEQETLFVTETDRLENESRTNPLPGN